MSNRCTACNARIAPTTRRCRRCGARVELVEASRDAVTLARPPLPYASGDKVGGRYAVIENHGAGPLGTTYRAQSDDGRAVAVKVLSNELAPTAEAREALVEEMRTMVGREMPHVMLPIDVGVDPAGVVFVVSPWVHGASLRSVLRAYRAAEKLLDPDQALALLQGAATALRELHTTGSHGAVYPESVHLTSDAVVLADPSLAAKLPTGVFAKYLESWPDVLAYIAPEIRAGKASSAGADLHGLGALASELLTGDSLRSRSPNFSLPSLGSEVEEALRALVSRRPAERAAALPMLLERLSRRAGAPSLPRYGQLPQPLGEERTQKAEMPPPKHVARRSAIERATPLFVHPPVEPPLVGRRPRTRPGASDETTKPRSRPTTQR